MIATNTCQQSKQVRLATDQIRKKRKWPRNFTYDFSRYLHHPPKEDLPKDIIQALTVCFLQLKPQEQQLLIHLYANGMSFDEAAVAMSWHPCPQYVSRRRSLILDKLAPVYDVIDLGLERFIQLYGSEKLQTQLRCVSGETTVSTDSMIIMLNAPAPVKEETTNWLAEFLSEMTKEEISSVPNDTEETLRQFVFCDETEWRIAKELICQRLSLAKIGSLNFLSESAVRFKLRRLKDKCCRAKNILMFGRKNFLEKYQGESPEETIRCRITGYEMINGDLSLCGLMLSAATTDFLQEAECSMITDLLSCEKGNIKLTPKKATELRTAFELYGICLK